MSHENKVQQDGLSAERGYGNLVDIKLGKRAMELLLFSPSEIDSLVSYNKDSSSSLSLATFFAGIIVALIIARCSLSGVEYHSSSLFAVFPFSVVICLILFAYYACRFYRLEYKEKPKIIERVKKESEDFKIKND